MHDIDRTQLEMYETPLQELQPEQFEFAAEGEYEGPVAGEAGYAGEEEYAGEGEYAGEDEWPGEFAQGETADEYAAGETYEGETYEGETYEGETYEGETYEGEEEVYEAPLSEAEQMELATELLEVASEEELDQFIGRLIRRVGRTLKRVVRSPIGRAIGGMLKPLARAALPIAGRAVGTFFGGPAGGMIGGRLASTAGRLFGLELEGLSQEDREYEVARRFVRFATAATQRAVRAPQGMPPAVAARRALALTARRLAPGLRMRAGGQPAATPYPDAAMAVGRNRGTWIRRGRRIILLGL